MPAMGVSSVAKSLAVRELEGHLAPTVPIGAVAEKNGHRYDYG
jgi:hypothetical protein